MKHAAFVLLLLAVAWPMNATGQPNPSLAKKCEKAFNLYQKRGFTYNLEVKRRQVVVYAGPGFFAAPIDIKEHFAMTVSCLLMKGDANRLAEFTIAHWQTGKRVARFHYGKLEIE